MMASTYRAIRLKGKGGLDQLEQVELPLVEPGRGELRIRVRASGAGSTDTTMRTGYYPYRPPFPFVQGYEVVGEVDALGEGVTGFSPGQRVCALTVYGGWGEYLVREAEHFVPVPEGLDDAEVIALILNYVTAYQMIHRSAHMQAGQRALVTGANGGVGTALLELLPILGAHAVGAASKSHFELVRALGGEPIESRTRPLDELVHALYPQGVDVAFDGLGGRGTGECVRATRKGGMVVSYGFMGTMQGGSSSTLAAARGFAALFLGARLSGRHAKFYGITQLYREDKRPLQEDLPKLFSLLQEKKIQPRIAARLPLLAGREALQRLEAGGITGKIVLVAGL
jgi:NADPH:quinone reductase-like Zn-dependent oxidoreductase